VQTRWQFFSERRWADVETAGIGMMSAASGAAMMGMVGTFASASAGSADIYTKFWQRPEAEHQTLSPATTAFTSHEPGQLPRQTQRGKR